MKGCPDRNLFTPARRPGRLRMKRRRGLCGDLRARTPGDQLYLDQQIKRPVEQHQLSSLHSTLFSPLLYTAT